MSDMQNFIDVPTQALTFKARLRDSIHTATAFISDQKWTSLAFLLVYMGLMYWDFLHSTLVDVQTTPAGAWLDRLPEFMAPIKQAFSQASQGTWRAGLAGLLTVLYWGNALLFIADRSSAFHQAPVVGLVRYMLRGMGIVFLLSAPIMIGLVLLLIPGFLMIATLMTAVTVALFQEQSVFRAIASGFRLSTRSLPGQARILGFSRSFFHIVGSYALTLFMNLSIFIVTVFICIGIAQLLPSKVLALRSLQNTLSNLVSSFISLIFSIFVLRLYAEHVNLGGKRHEDLG